MEGSDRPPAWNNWKIEDGPRRRILRGQARQAGQERVVEDPELARPVLPVAGHVRGAGLDQAEATLGPAAHPAQLVVAEGAVIVALLVGQRRQERPVPDDEAGGEDQRLEKGHPDDYGAAGWA